MENVKRMNVEAYWYRDKRYTCIRRTVEGSNIPLIRQTYLKYVGSLTSSRMTEIPRLEKGMRADEQYLLWNRRNSETWKIRKSRGEVRFFISSFRANILSEGATGDNALRSVPFENIFFALDEETASRETRITLVKPRLITPGSPSSFLHFCDFADIRSDKRDRNVVRRSLSEFQIRQSTTK